MWAHLQTEVPGKDRDHKPSENALWYEKLSNKDAESSKEKW